MHEDKLTLNKEMKGTWLIQRLQKPTQYELKGKRNPFSFGGGLKNGGLSDDAMGLLRGIFSFDYMGAAEFEFGAVPQAIKFIAEQALKHNLIAATLILDTKGNEKVYYITPRDYAPEVVCRIKQLRKDELRLKEWCGLDKYFDGFFGKPSKENVGWLELDNGFFFFVDRTMYESVCKLFGIELVNKP
jgi:hypothetical protein